MSESSERWWICPVCLGVWSTCPDTERHTTQQNYWCDGRPTRVVPASELERLRETRVDSGIRVTVEDLKTGDTDSVVIRDDYVCICAGSCYVAHTQAWGKSATHQLTIKGRNPGAEGAEG